MTQRRFVDPRLDAIRHTPHICLAESLRSATRAISRRYSSYLTDSGLGPAQMSLLMRLYYLGPTPIAKLAEQMETDRTTLTRTLKLLSDSRHVEIVEGRDRRQKLVQMTDLGFSTLTAAIPQWEKAQSDLQALLGPQSWAALLAEARKLVEVEGIACDRRGHPNAAQSEASAVSGEGRPR